MASSAPDTRESSGALVDITVKTLDAQNRSFTVPENLTVRQFKEKISGSIEIPADTQRLIYQGRVMQDDKPLKDYDIHGKAIHVVQRAPPSNLTGSGSSNTGAERSTTNPRPNGGGVDANLLDVQIHVGRVQQGSNGHGARCRFRQAQFHNGIINDAFDLLRERTDISENDFPPPDYTESVQGEERGQEEMDTSTSQSEAADTTSQTNSQAQSEGSQSSGTESLPATLSATELADFLDRVLNTNNRMVPYLRLYRNYLRNEQNYPRESQELRNAQEVMDRVSEALHAMSHLMHNLSDVIIDMSTDTPRTITAGPPPPSINAVPGATSMAIPIHMNVRARHGANGGRPRSRHQAQSQATPTTTAASSGQTASENNNSGSESNTPTTETPASSIPPQGNTQTTGGEAPPVTANFNAGPVPGIMQATVDITQGFRLPPGAMPLNLGNLANLGNLGNLGNMGDPTNIMMVVSDIQTAVDGHQPSVATSVSSTPAATGTTSAPGGPSPTTANTTGASSRPSTTTTSSTTSSSSSSTSGSTSITFGPTTSINLGPGMNLGNLPNVPGLPSGILQNILGSVLAQHGVHPGQPVRVNMVQQPRPPGSEQRQGVNDLPLDGDTQTPDWSQARADASHQTPSTMEASAGTRSNVATNTSQSNVAPAVNAATNTSSSGPSSSRTTSTGADSVRASVGTHTDPTFNTSSRSTNTPGRPSVHIHRGSMGTPGGVRLPGPTIGIPGGAGGRGHVDPFLPCHSSHYNSESVRRVQRSSQNQQNMVPNLSTMVSGLVGDIIEQVGQAINTGGNGTRVTSSGSTPASSTSTTTSSATGRTSATSSASTTPTGTSTSHHSATTTSFNPSSLPINPMDILNMMQGQRGPSGSPHAPMSLDLGSLLGGMMNPMMQGSGPGPTGSTTGTTGGSTGTLAELITQFREVSSGSDEDNDEPSGVMGSLLESMAPHIYLSDLLSLTLGNTEVLGRLRQPMHQCVEERLTQHGSIEELVQTALNDLQPNIRHIESLVDVREGVDMSRSIRECLQTHLRILFTFIHANTAGSNTEYGRQLHGLWMTMMADVIALCIYCIKDGHQGFCNMLEAYMPRLTQGMNPMVTGFMTNSLQDILSSFHRNHPVPESAIMKYVVRTQASETSVGDGATGTKGSTSSSVPLAQATPRPVPRDVPSEARSAVGTQAVPMDVSLSPSPQPPKAKVARTGEKTGDVSETMSKNTTTTTSNNKPNKLSTSTAASSRIVGRESSQLTNGQNGDTSWQSVIPQEWIPVINQDTVRQQSQRLQNPVSDAYLQGLPAKRRRMMGLEHAGEMGNMAQYLPDSLSRAARAAGAEPISSEENMLQEASDNLSLQADLEREVASVLESRVANDQDHSADRFPNSNLYFHKSRKH